MLTSLWPVSYAFVLHHHHLHHLLLCGAALLLFCAFCVFCCRAFDKEGRCQDRLGTNIFNYGAFGCTQPQQVYVKVVPATATATVTGGGGGGVVVNPLAPGQTVDLEPEQKAAKEALREDSGLPHEVIQALYQAPGSQ